MIFKEREILLPMCLDTLEEAEWHAIARQSPEFGFCLYDPQVEWSAEASRGPQKWGTVGRVLLPTGSMAPVEIEAILNTIPFDLTFVDAEDRCVIHARGRAHLQPIRGPSSAGRSRCGHPPSSVDVVEKIISDFKAGRAAARRSGST